MKTRTLVILAAAALLESGCAVTYIRRDAESATAFRGSLGTDAGFDSLEAADGKGAKLEVARAKSSQSPAAGKALEAAQAVAPLLAP